MTDEEKAKREEMVKKRKEKQAEREANMTDEEKKKRAEIRKER